MASKSCVALFRSYIELKKNLDDSIEKRFKFVNNLLNSAKYRIQKYTHIDKDHMKEFT